MKQIIKPMLAVEVNFDKLRYPIYTQPKLDGIRVIIKDGIVYSRSLKAIPNKYVQSLFGHLHGLDGELIVGNPTAHDVFQKTTSGVMSKYGEPDVTLYAFDMWNQTGKTYESRYNTLSEVIYQQPQVQIKLRAVELAPQGKPDFNKIFEKGQTASLRVIEKQVKPVLLAGIISKMIDGINSYFNVVRPMTNAQIEELTIDMMQLKDHRLEDFFSVFRGNKKRTLRKNI